MVKFIVLILFMLVITPVFGNDPTRPFSALQQSSNKRLNHSVKRQQKLSAIFKRNNKSTAIIGQKSYHVGDFYRGNKILKIYPDRVLLKNGQGRFHLTLIPKIKK